MPTSGLPMILPLALCGGDPQGGRCYEATVPTCGPPVILPLAVKRWGPPRRQGLCSPLAHLWGTFDCAPRSEAVGTPQVAGVMQPPCPLFGHLSFCLASVTCKRASYPDVYIDFLNGILVRPLYKGVGHRDSTLMRSPRRPRSCVFSFFPAPTGILKLHTTAGCGRWQVRTHGHSNLRWWPQTTQRQATSTSPRLHHTVNAQA